MRIFQSFKWSGSLGRPADSFFGKKQQKQQNPAKDHALMSLELTGEFAIAYLYRKRNG